MTPAANAPRCIDIDGLVNVVQPPAPPPYCGDCGRRVVLTNTGYHHAYQGDVA